MKRKIYSCDARIILSVLIGLFLSFNVLAQNVALKGNVKDANGEAIIGASVLQAGTTNGTITDIDGNFILSAPEGSSITISYVGYVTQNIVNHGQSNLIVVLKEDSEVLDEVVVIGYGQVKKNDLTGSVTAIDADKMVKGAVSSATDMLTGKAAGVSVVSSGGAPGAGATIRIRGGSSMSASNDPLIVIDGVPVDNSEIKGMSNPLLTVHPSDIATFTILKDASATAIYGSRASNGVILITTKTGKEGKVKVGYNGSFSVNTRAGKIDVMDADEFRNFVITKFGAGSPQAEALGSANTDWQDQIFHAAVSTDHNVSVSGAVPHMPYRVSASYSTENGILKTSNMQRTTGAINLNPNFFDKKLNIQLNVKGIYNRNRFADTGAIGAATQFNPTKPVYQDGLAFGNGYYLDMQKPDPDKPSFVPQPIGIAISNPLAMLEEKDDVSDVYRSIGNAQIDYRFHFLPELRANLNVAYDVSKSEEDKIIYDNSSMTYSSGNYKAGWGENEHIYQLKRTHLLDFYLNYVKEFGINNIDVMAGYSWQHFYNKTENAYPYSTAMAEKEGKADYKDSQQFETESYLVSFFGRLNYTLLGRYLFTFTLRDDGSSRFSPDNRWGIFPSAALAWRMKDETFLKDIAVLSDLKLRLGWGITGQQNLGNGDYPYMARYQYSKAGANYYFGDTKVNLLAPLEYDADLKWEETTTWNAGLDFGFLSGRLTGSVDAYFRTTKDLLNTVAVPAGANFSNELLTNVGELENKGFEVTINTHPIVTKDWNWTLGFNLSYNKNRITKLTVNDDPNYPGVQHSGIDGATGYKAMIHKVGQPFNSFYVYEQIYRPDGSPIEGAYVDQNQDGKIDEKDLICFKKAAPDVFLGLTSQLSYKQWDLNFGLRASFGNSVYNNIQSNREAWAGSQMYDQAGFLKNRLTSAEKTNFQISQPLSSYYVQNASFLRMDNITLGYTFDKVFRAGQTARVYFTVQNPFVITKYSGLDPEIGRTSTDEDNTGMDNNIYPRPRTYMIGLNVNF